MYINEKQKQKNKNKFTIIVQRKQVYLRDFQIQIYIRLLTISYRFVVSGYRNIRYTATLAARVRAAHCLASVRLRRHLHQFPPLPPLRPRPQQASPPPLPSLSVAVLAGSATGLLPGYFHPTPSVRLTSFHPRRPIAPSPRDPNPHTRRLLHLTEVNKKGSAVPYPPSLPHFSGSELAGQKLASRFAQRFYLAFPRPIPFHRHPPTSLSSSSRFWRYFLGGSRDEDRDISDFL